MRKSIHRWCSVRRGGALLAGLLLGSTVASGSLRSDEIMVAGGAALRGQHYELALDRFEAAAREDPGDPEAPFFAAVCLNRLQRPQEALAHLRSASEARSNQPDMSFETGWALLMLARWPAAIEQLERYEREHPGRGQTQEFLGVAYLGMGKEREALVAFDEAVRRDPDLRQLVDSYRNGISQGFAGTFVGPSGAPNGVLAGAPVRSGPVPQPPVGAKVGAAAGHSPWELSISVAGGYNSDARGLGELYPGEHPKDPKTHKDFSPNRGSPFVESILEAGLTLARTSSDDLRLDYRALSDQYARSNTQADLIDQRIEVSWEHVLNHSISVGVRFSDEFTLVDDVFFRNFVEGRGALIWRAAPHLDIEASLAYGYNDYIQVARRVDPDGLTQTVALTAFWAWPATKIHAYVGVFNTVDRTLGTDSDYVGDGVSVGGSAPLLWNVTASLRYSHEFDVYANINSATRPPFKRRDAIDVASARLTKPIGENLWAYVEYIYTSDPSNVKFYRYRQSFVTSGLTWRF